MCVCVCVCVCVCASEKEIVERERGSLYVCMKERERESFDLLGKPWPVPKIASHIFLPFDPFPVSQIIRIKKENGYLNNMPR